MIRLIVVILIFLSLFENPFVSRGQCPEQILDIAKTHISGGDNANALSELDKLYSNSLHFKQSDSIANALKEAGTLCFSINHYLKALQFFRLGYQVADSFGDSRVKIACSGNMGVVFAVMNDNGTAVYYLEKAFNEAYAQGFMDLAHIYANNLVVALCDIGDVERARIYVDKNAALTKDSTPVTHFTLIKDKYLIAEATHDVLGMMKSAKEVYSYVNECNMEPFYKTAAYEFMGNSFQELCQYDSAIYYYTKSIDVIRGLSAYDLYLKKLKKLANVYSLTGDVKKHNKCMDEIVVLSDSIHNPVSAAEAKEEFWQMNDRFQDEFIGELNHTINRQSLIIFIVSVSLAIMLALIGIIVYLYKKRQKMYENLYKRNLELINPVESDSIQNSDDTQENNECSVTMNDNKRQSLLNDIVKTMNDIEIITDPEFNLNALVRIVGSNVNYVSSVINTMLNKNFKGYLNEQRILEACRRLRENTDEFTTIAMLGESVGYKAESSFFQAFRKIVGMTPLEYRKMAAKQNPEN